MFFLVLSSLVSSTHALSMGTETGCDVFLDFGGSIMNWATAPIRNEDYSLRTGLGEDPVTDPWRYQPDTILPLYLDVLAVDAQYRGLVLYAVNRTEDKVGDWSFGEESPPVFHKPLGPGCEGKSVVHAQAAHKAYREVFYFKTPPAGTGPIKFRLLLKRGGPNVGSFAFPMKEDLLLVEYDPDEFAEQNVFAGEVGQSCNQVCRSEGTSCDGDALMMTYDAAGQDDFLSDISSHVVCFPPLIQNCSVSVPSTAGDVEVDMTSSSFGLDSCSTPASCPSEGVTASGLCSATVSDRAPICQCKLKATTQEDGGGYKASVEGVFMWIFLIFMLIACAAIFVMRRKVSNVGQISVKSFAASSPSASPAALSSVEGSSSQTTLGAEEWIAKLDESSGATYYINTQTGVSVWEKPAGMA